MLSFLDSLEEDETIFLTESPAAKAWSSTFSDSAIAISVMEELISSVTRASSYPSMYSVGESFLHKTSMVFPNSVASIKNTWKSVLSPDVISDIRNGQLCINSPDISLHLDRKKDTNDCKMRAKKAKKKFLART